MESTMCKKCGTVIMPDEFFCPQCGTPVKMLPPGEGRESAVVNPESSDQKSADSQQLFNSYLQGDEVLGSRYDDFWTKPGSSFNKDGTPAPDDSLQQKMSAWDEVLPQESAGTEQAEAYQEAAKTDTDLANDWGTESPVHKDLEQKSETTVQNKASAVDVTINQDTWNEWMRNNILQQQKAGNRSEGTGSLISGLFGRKKKNS